MVEILCAAIAAVATVVAAACSGRVARSSRQAEKRAERRARESRLSMELMYATCALSLTTAKKLAGLHTNGDVEHALRKADEAQAAYIDFVRDEAARNVAKV